MSFFKTQILINFKDKSSKKKEKKTIPFFIFPFVFFNYFFLLNYLVFFCFYKEKYLKMNIYCFLVKYKF